MDLLLGPLAALTSSTVAFSMSFPGRRGLPRHERRRSDSLRPWAETPGNFTIYRRVDGWRQSTLGLMWRPNYFYRGYAVHGSTSVPAYPASHGCVRVTVPAMNRLWSLLRIGMALSVYR